MAATPSTSRHVTKLETRICPQPASQSFTVSLPTFTLTVSKAGSGEGTVTGTGISCGADCSETFNSGASVNLTAVSDPGSTLTGWSGCDSLAASCTVTMNVNRTVTAKFSKDFDPITAGVTPVKALHITELRDAINTLRSRNGLPAFSFGSAPTAGVTEIQAGHIRDLRSALDAVYGVVKPSYTPIVPRQTVIEKAHIDEIRNAVRDVE